MIFNTTALRTIGAKLGGVCVDDIGVVFGKRLKLLLDDADEKQVYLAEVMNVEEPTVSRYVNGRVPPIGILIRIADHFDVSLDYLIGRTDNPRGQKGIDMVASEYAAIIRGAKKLGISPEALADAVQFLAKHQESKRRED